MGESGSGKSTLVKTMAGLLDADQGTVQVNDEVITGPRHNLVPGYESIAYVSQDFKLQNYWSVEDNVGKKISHLPDDEKQQEIMEWLKLFQLDSYTESMPGELSGGQQQRIAIAAAVIDQPPVILMDEPFSNLDLPLKAKMRQEMIEKLRKNGTTIVLISHDPAEAMAVADKILLLRAGKIEQFDSPENLYRRPSSYYAASFLGPVNQIHKEGEEVLARPEELIIDSSGKLKGFVTACEFAGRSYHCHIKLNGQAKEVLVYAEQKLNKGAKVNLTLIK